MLGGVHGDRGDVGSRQTTSRTALVPNGPGHQEGIVTKARVVGLRSDLAITAKRKEKVIFQSWIIMSCTALPSTSNFEAGLRSHHPKSVRLFICALGFEDSSRNIPEQKLE